MRVLVTGGAGYIGNSLVPQLLERSSVDHVTVYDSLQRGNINLFASGRATGHGSRLSLVQAELLDTATLTQAVSTHDVVVHLAAHVTTPFADHDAHRFEQVNHWGTAQLAHVLEQTPVSKLIYVSSTAVYGSSDQMSSLETRPSPTTHYGISKLRGEDHVRRLIGGPTHTQILRCANVYGYNGGLRLDSVVNNFMFRAHHGLRLLVVGDGTQRRPFYQVARLGRAIAAAAVDSDRAPGTHNLVERNLSVMQVLETVLELYPEVEYVFTDQVMTMRNLEVEVPSSGSEPEDLQSFHQDLVAFRAAFAY